MKEVRQEFEQAEKNKDVAIRYIRDAEREAREFARQGDALNLDIKTRSELLSYSAMALEVEQRLKVAFKGYSSLPDLKKLDVKTSQLIGLLDSEKIKLEQQYKNLEITSEEEALLKALENLKELQNLSEQNLALSKTCDTFQKQMATLTKIKERFIDIQNTALQEALDVMSENIWKYYLAMPPQEEVDDVKLRVIGEEGVEFRYCFHGKETGPPNQIFERIAFKQPWHRSVSGFGETV